MYVKDFRTPETLAHIEFIKKNAGKIRCAEIAKIRGISPSYTSSLASQVGLSLKLPQVAKPIVPAPSIKNQDRIFPYPTQPYTKDDLNLSSLEKFVFCKPWKPVYSQHLVNL